MTKPSAQEILDSLHRGRIDYDGGYALVHQDGAKYATLSRLEWHTDGSVTLHYLDKFLTREDGLAALVYLAQCDAAVNEDAEAARHLAQDSTQPERSKS